MESKTDRILSKCLEATLGGLDDNLPKISAAAKMFLKIMVGILAAAVILVGIGILAKNNGLVAFGNICKAAVSGIIMGGFASLSIPWSGGKYIRATLVCAASQLIISAVMYWSPMSITFESYFLLNIGLAVVCLALWAQNPPMQIVGGIVTIAALGMLLFPTQADLLKRGIRGASAAEPAKFNHGDISGNKKPFFDRYGNSLYDYSFGDGKYTLFEDGKYDSSSGEKLMPVTRELARKLKKNEDLLSPHNFIGDTTSAGTPSAGSYATAPPPAAVPEPPPAPAPYVPSPPAVSEPAPPPAAAPTQEPAPAPSYQPPTPEKPQERTPVPRYKYATLFIGDSGTPDPSYSQDLASWFDSDGVSAADTFRHLSLSYRGTLLDSDRRRLGSLAENIVIVKCSTRPDFSRSRDRLYTCDLETKVIDTRTGEEVVKPFRKSHTSSGSTDQKARQSAITLALAKVKNNLP